MKRLFLLLGLIGVLAFVAPNQTFAQSDISVCSSGVYQDYDGIVQVYSKKRDDWYRVTMFFYGDDVTFVIEGRSEGVSGLYYSGKDKRESWFAAMKQYLDQVYGTSSYSIHFGPNLLTTN